MLKDPPVTIFDLAQKQIFNLMKFDSYPRFLKSDLYKQCVAGNMNPPQLDAGLLLYPPSSTPSKLKKSLSNAEDRRRKSLLPWNRRNRSKSKDRGELEYNHHNTDAMINSINKTSRNTVSTSDVHSSKSSLTSLDLAVVHQVNDFLGCLILHKI